MIRARSSLCWCSSANHFSSTAPRSLAVVARQTGQALSAATMAWWHSTAPKLATSASTSPVADQAPPKLDQHGDAIRAALAKSDEWPSR